MSIWLLWLAVAGENPALTIFIMKARKEQEYSGTPFNMAMMFYVSLTKLIEAKDMAFIHRDMEKYYRCLCAIKHKISFKGVENKELWAQVNEHLRKASSVLNAKPMNVEAYYKAKNEVLHVHLEKVDDMLTEIMDKHKMIFPNIEIVGGLDAIRERYGLQ